MENDINKAAAELAELNDFLMDISRRTAKDVIETMRKRDPDYLESVKSTGEMPEESTDLMIDYGIWSLLRLNNAYKDNWKEVIETYIKTDSQPGRPQLVKSLWDHVEMVIKG